MVPDIDSPSASRPRTGICEPPWLVASLVVAAVAGSAYLGAQWMAESLHAELTLRPPVILFDIAAAVRDVEPAQLGAAVARQKEQAERLAAGGFLVLDAQAVIAAPRELYLTPDAVPEGKGDPPR
jgi:hypothetical protein